MADEKQKSACLRRHDQIKRWDDSDTSKQPTVLNKTQTKVKFHDGCIFLAACSCGDVEEVTTLLKRGADINTANVDGLTALHQACIDDNLDMVEFLIENGADIDVCDNEGWTPLHATASCGYCEIARFLLEYGANAAAVNNDGDLAIDLATENDMEELLAEYMEKQQIDADSARNEEENRMLADANQWLNNRNVREKPHPKTGATALHVAAAKGYLKVMQILLMAGVDIEAKDTDGWTPLHAAAHWGEEEACKLLVENMCNMEARNYSGQTCFDVADDDLLKLLEDLKIKQASRREDSKKEIPHLDIIETKHPMKRRDSDKRTSITRMSMDQKQHINLGDVHEERQKMEALMHKHDIPLIDEDTKEEEKKSSPSSSSEESSSDSETVSEKQNELNPQLLAKPVTQEKVQENDKKPEQKSAEPAQSSPIEEPQPTVQKPSEPSEPEEVPVKTAPPSVNGEVTVSETKTTATLTIKENEVTEKPVAKKESSPKDDVSSDVSVSFSLNNQQPAVSASETVKSTPEVVSKDTPTSATVVPSTKVDETPSEPEKLTVDEEQKPTETTEALSSSEVRRRRRRQLKEEAEMMDKKYAEERNKAERERVSLKEEQKQKETDKEVADEDPQEPAVSNEVPAKEPLHRTASLPARLSRQAPNYSPRPLSSRIESNAGPSSWRAGLRKAGSSSAVPDTAPLRKIGEERVQKSASSPWLAPELKSEDTQERSYRRQYLSSTSSVPENPPENPPEITTRNRNTYPYLSRVQTSSSTGAAGSSVQSEYVPYSRRRQEREAEREKERLNAGTALGTTSVSFRRSFEPPKRDEETETQRKLRARRARETRRSTQGVTKEDVAAAEATLQLADTDKNGRTSSALTSKLTDATDTKPEDSSSTYVRRRRDYSTKVDDTANLSASTNSFRRSRDYAATTTTDLSSSTGYIPRSQRLSAQLTDAATTSSATTTATTTTTSLPTRTSYRQRQLAAEEDKTDAAKVEDKKVEEKKEDANNGLDPHERRLASIRERRRERRSSALAQNINAKEDSTEETKKEPAKTEPEDTSSSSRYSDRYGAGERSSYSDRYSSTRSSTRDADRPSSSYRYSRASTTAAATESESQDFKKLYDEQKAENERIKKELTKVQKEYADCKTELEKTKSSQSRLGNSLDQREKRTLERKISEMEEELKQMELLKQDNQRLKEENGALIRVISKLSK